MTRSRSGFVLGPLVVGLMRQRMGAPTIERCSTFANGLLHRAVAVRLSFRRHPNGLFASGPALLLAWRL